MPAVSMTVNGKAVTADVDPRTLLVEFLRQDCRLTGTHVGCDTTQCGACTVNLDGVAVKSCTVLAVQAQGTSVTTLEGLGTPEDLHPVQAAFRGGPSLPVRPSTWASGRRMKRWASTPTAAAAMKKCLILFSLSSFASS